MGRNARRAFYSRYFSFACRYSIILAFTAFHERVHFGDEAAGTDFLQLFWSVNLPSWISDTSPCVDSRCSNSSLLFQHSFDPFGLVADYSRYCSTLVELDDRTDPLNKMGISSEKYHETCP